MGSKIFSARLRFGQARDFGLVADYLSRELRGASALDRKQMLLEYYFLLLDIDSRKLPDADVIKARPKNRRFTIHVLHQVQNWLKTRPDDPFPYCLAALTAKYISDDYYRLGSQIGLLNFESSDAHYADRYRMIACGGRYSLKRVLRFRRFSRHIMFLALKNSLRAYLVSGQEPQLAALMLDIWSNWNYFPLCGAIRSRLLQIMRQYWPKAFEIALDNETAKWCHQDWLKFGQAHKLVPAGITIAEPEKELFGNRCWPSFIALPLIAWTSQIRSFVPAEAGIAAAWPAREHLMRCRYIKNTDSQIKECLRMEEAALVERSYENLKGLEAAIIRQKLLDACART
ncbi:MAG: hypothetical protein HY747_06555 [Elusimicrobia bacterium]|nr:hypothetical protein [Elusimicrobiota bacterium]